MKPELGDCAVYSMQKVKVEDLADFPTHQVDEKYVKKDTTAQALLGEVNIQFRIIWYVWVYNLVCDLTSNSQLIEITIFRDSCTHI